MWAPLYDRSRCSRHKTAPRRVVNGLPLYLASLRGAKMLASLAFYLLFSFTSSAVATADLGACCFIHPNYSGVCVVQPAANETCSSILEYLNSPGSAGKAYCGNTPIRGG